VTAGHLHLAVALDGAGHHPAAWRDPGARPGRLFDGAYWAGLAQEAERGLLDLVTFDDSFGPPPQPRGRTDRVRARPDAALVAARVAPLTRHVGLVPVVTTTHTEPFHVASGISTLDHSSGGRAGWQARVSAHPGEAALVGVRPTPPVDEVFAEAADVVEVVRRLWDSWEDDAAIRDVATGRFVDRDKLHYVDFAGPTFSVKGPSIVPRPPQGQPVVAVLSHVPLADHLAARAADVVFVTPRDGDDTARRLADIRAAEAAVARPGEPLRVLADLVVFLAGSPAAAAARRDRLDALDGAPWQPDAAVFAGTAAELADQLVAGRDAGLDGWRLRPGVLPHDLTAIVDGLVPELRRRGAVRAADEHGTLRARLGLPRPANRYAGSRP
jgi:alkanesulfonate monooxygenase SsuD/methylene tetrahydromethanopterin reductase-like flavin-dependent oxidoreductase (luciferase family)